MAVYSSIYDGPPNRYGSNKTTKKWIVIHNTSNDAPASNEASYAKRRTDSVSSHYYVDGERIIQSLNTDYRAFHVGSVTGNAGGIAYEITGTNAKSRSWWLANVRWDLLAAQIRKDCAAHGITPRLLTVEEIQAGKTGIMTHDQARRAWGGTDHTDPGPGFPMDHLLAQVKGDPSSEQTELPGGIMLPSKGDKGEVVKYWQRLLIMDGIPLPKYGADGGYEDETVAAVRAWFKRESGGKDFHGRNITSWIAVNLQANVFRGAKGERGPAGKDGRDGVLQLPATVEIRGQVTSFAGGE